MSLLYILFIEPLIFLYQVSFDEFANASENFIAALALLSILHTILFIPFKKIASGLHSKEQKIRAKIDSQLALIGKEYRGLDRHRHTAALYKRFSYHPLMALRSASSILFQLPFLMAAYFMLSDHAGIKFQPISFISDLSKPDQYLFGLNLLPLVMTLINWGVILTTKDFERKNRFQAASLSIVFLALLYNAPSALVVFWTFNNCISLFQNIFQKIDFSFPFQYKRDSIKNIKLFNVNESNIFFWGIATLAAHLFIFGPAALYFSDRQAYFFQGVWSILLQILPFLSLWFLLFYWAWRIFPLKFRSILVLLVLFLAVNSTLISFFSFVDYGDLDGFVLTGFSDVILNKKLIVDFSISFLSILFCIGVIIWKLNTQIIYALKIIVLGLLIFPIINSILETKPLEEATNQNLRNALEFSKEETNTLIFILDMFTGSHIGDIFTLEPNLKEKYSGFTWYSDTLAAGSSTLVGIPAILGGHSYTALEMNKDKNASNRLKVNQGIATLPRVFGKKKNDVALLNIPFFYDDKLFLEAAQYNELITVIPNADRVAYKDAKLASSPPFFALAISLFRITPHTLRGRVYKNGHWLGAYKASNEFINQKSAVALLAGLPDLSSIGSKAPANLKIIYSKLSHFPFHLAKNSVTFVDNPEPNIPQSARGKELKGKISLAHLYSEKHIINFLGTFFDDLKLKGVYDNTKIILVSDHSFKDSAVLSKAFDGNHGYPGNPDALLMVKDLGSKHEFKKSTLFMSTADVPFFACRHFEAKLCENLSLNIENYLEQENINTRKIQRLLYHQVGGAQFRHHPNSQFKLQNYLVSGSSLNKYNWRLLNKKEEESLLVPFAENKSD